MPLVDIPDVGRISFPDTMSDDEISTAIERDILKRDVGAFVSEPDAAPTISSQLTPGHIPQTFSSVIAPMPKTQDEALLSQVPPGTEPVSIGGQGDLKFPKITPQDITSTTGLPAAVAKPLAGVQQAITEVADFFLTEEGLATLGIGSIGPAAQKAVATYFVGQMAKEAPQQFTESYKAFKEGDTEKGTRLLIGGAIGTTLVGMGIREALAPKTAAALKQTEREVSNASPIGETKTLHGDVRPQQEPASGVPVEESGSRVQLQTQQEQTAPPPVSEPRIEESKPAPVESEQAPHSAAPATAAVSEAKPPGVAAPEAPSAISDTTTQPKTLQPVASIESVPATENGGRIAIILPNGKAVVGGRIHADTWNRALEAGVATDKEMQDGFAGFVKPDGTAWGVNGKPLPNVSEVFLVGAEKPKPPARPDQRPPEPRAETEVQQQAQPSEQPTPAAQVERPGAADSGPGIVGMGGATLEEFSQPTIEQLIQPHLREGIEKLGGPESTEPAPRSFIRKISDFFTGDRQSNVSNAIRGWLGTMAGKTLPKTTLADRQSGELGGRFVASRAASIPMGNVFSNDVLAGLKVDQAKFDAALKADNLLSIRETFLAEAEKAEDPALAAKLQEAAANVNTLLGTDKFPFATEQQLADYFKDPEVAEAVSRHRDNWQATIEPLYRITQDIDPDVELPTRGKYSQARINLNPIVEGTYEPANGQRVGGGSSGNVTGTMRRRNPFSLRAKGTGQSYVLNYAETMANSFAKQLEIANKKAFEDRLVETGNAVIAKPGQRVVLKDGAATKGYPLTRKGFVNQNIYIRDSLAKEYEIASNVVLNPYRNSLFVGFNQIAAKAALAGLTDATVHVENLGTALFQVPGGSGAPLLVDSILSGAFRADILAAVGRGIGKQAPGFLAHASKFLPESINAAVNKALAKNMTQMAAIAQINAYRVPHESHGFGYRALSKTVLKADQATRMVLDDTFTNLVRQGLVKGTETNRREFINQAGNYNLRSQGPWMRFLRQTWTAPFATAGRNFATLGVRGITLNPGAESTGIAASVALRANMASKWIGTAALVATANYLITGKLMGRPGTPLGAIDTGQTDANGRPKYFNVAAFTGQSRALRTVGARGAIESTRLGLRPSDAAQSAVRDVSNVALGALAGPGVRAATIATTGYSPAVNVGRASRVAPPGEIQAVENVKEALLQANPIVASIHEATRPGGNIAKAIERQIPRFTLTTGKPADMLEKYPKIVEMAQSKEFVEDVIHQARQLPKADRLRYVETQIRRLPPAEQSRARNEVRRRRVYQ